VKKVLLCCIAMIFIPLFSGCVNDDTGEDSSLDYSSSPAFNDESADGSVDGSMDEPSISEETNMNEIPIPNHEDLIAEDPPPPVFVDANVHDPSVFRVGDTFYVIGSHMSMAKTDDFMKWTQVSAYVTHNPLVPNVREDFKEAFEWAQTDTFWAGDIEPMPDGRFFMYYCNCEGSKPLGNIGLAISDHPEGPYENQGIFLKSGMSGTSHDGSYYDATRHPNAIDPHAFFDSEGQFRMVYGSYSGGIFILDMDPETGLPLEDQGYGTKLLGGNHSRIEGPYIIHSPETGYYYLFLTFGGLDHNGGYNIRVARSLNPDGPYYDAQGNAMIDAMGPRGSFFADAYIEPFGTKIVGGYHFLGGEGVRGTRHVSPGHNSVYYDEESGRYYLIFHSRFGHTDAHRIRVHEMFLNEDGWFIASPFRYDGTSHRSFRPEHVPGIWRLINHGRSINTTPIDSEIAVFYPDGTITGIESGSLTGTVNETENDFENSFENGSWFLDPDGVTFKVTLDDVEYNGRLLRSWDQDAEEWIMSFTALSNDGIALWGAGG